MQAIASAIASGQQAPFQGPAVPSVIRGIVQGLLGAGNWIVHNPQQHRDNLEMALDSRLDARTNLGGALSAWLAQNAYEHPYTGPH